MKNKKLLIIPIILIILLVLCAGVSAILYLQTDLFKSPKQLFFKYLGESIKIDENFDYDKILAEYKEKSEKSYTATGEITASLDYDELDNELDNYNNSSSSSSSISSSLNSTKKILQTSKDALDKTKIEYSAESIPVKNKYHMNIKPIYNGNEITNLELLTSDDNYGIKCSDLYDKYVYIENNNLKTLASKLGINSSNIPDKITKTDLYELLYIAPETRQQISDKYTKLFDEKLTEDMFTKQNKVYTSVNGENIETDTYTLTLNGDQAYDIMLSFLETLKEDDATLNIIVQKIEQSGFKQSIESEYSSMSSTLIADSSNSSKKTTITLDKNYLKEMIQDLIDELKDEQINFSANDKLEITIYSSKREPVKLEFKNNKNDDSINIEITNNKNEKLVTLNSNESTYLKVNYSSLNNKNSVIMTAYDDNGDEVTSLNIEAGKDNSKVILKVTSNNSSSYSSSSSLDKTYIEVNFESNGEVGKGNVTSTGYVKINTSGVIITLNINQNTNYTDYINIDDLTANNGDLINEMSNTKMNSLIQEIYTNLQKVLPEKAKLLGIKVPVTNTEESNPEEISTEQNDTQNFTITEENSNLETNTLITNTITEQNNNDNLLSLF